MNLLERPALHALSRHRVAAIAFGAGAFVLAACESAGTGGRTNPSALGILAKGAPVTASTPSYSFQPYVYETYNTKITGLDDDKNGKPLSISGNYYSAGSNNQPHSFISTSSSSSAGTYSGPTPYPPNARPNTYISALNDIETTSSTYGGVGFSPPFDPTYGCASTSNNHLCGVIYDPQNHTTAGHLYQVRDPNEGTGSCAATYLYGTYGSAIQVGYYTDANCNAHGIEEYKYPHGDPQFVDFPQSQLSSVGCDGVQSWAYGINHDDVVVGACTSSSTNGPKMIGWRYKDFNYSSIVMLDAHNKQLWTQALGVNSAGLVVGSYEDSSAVHKMHGFVSGQSTFYTVDYTAGGVDDATVVNFYEQQTNYCWMVLQRHHRQQRDRICCNVQPQIEPVPE